MHFAWPEFIAQIVTFFITLGILYAFFYKPIAKLINARAEKIKNDIEKAEDFKKEMEKLKNDYQEEMNQVEKRAVEMEREYMQKSLDVRNEMVSQARDESQQILDKTKEQILREKKDAIKELRGDVAKLSIKLAEKILGESINKKKQEKLIKSFMKDFKP